MYLEISDLWRFTPLFSPHRKTECLIFLLNPTPVPLFLQLCLVPHPEILKHSYEILNHTLNGITVTCMSPLYCWSLRSREDGLVIFVCLKVFNLNSLQKKKWGFHILVGKHHCILISSCYSEGRLGGFGSHLCIVSGIVPCADLTPVSSVTPVRPSHQLIHMAFLVISNSLAAGKC